MNQLTLESLTPPPMREAFSILRRDLMNKGGPRISTMRNYRFAIIQYEKEDEFRLRAEVRSLSLDLQANGWTVLTINLQQLLLERARQQGEPWMERVIEMERRTHGVSPERGLNYLKSKLSPLIEGENGLAADCGRIIREYADRHPEKIDRTLALVGRAGAVYPFFRSSALLRRLDTQTRNVPVILLYPGTRSGQTGLKFMGIVSPDSDYRPRIYSCSHPA